MFYRMQHDMVSVSPADYLAHVQSSRSRSRLDHMYQMPYEWVTLGIGYHRRGQKTRMIGLPDGRKSVKIGLAVLIQYWRVIDTHPPSHPATQPRCHSKDRAYIYVAWVIIGDFSRKLHFFPPPPCM